MAIHKMNSMTILLGHSSSEETLLNELQIKQPKSKKFELVILGASITKRINPSFTTRSNKSFALNYSVGGTKVREVHAQMQIFRKNYQEAAITNVVIHVGTNCLPRNHSSNITVKINYYYMQRKNFQIYGFTFLQSYLNLTTHF